MDKLGRQTLGPAEWGLARSLGRKELAGLGRRYIVGRMEAVSSPFLTEFLLQSVYESATNLFQIPRCQCRFPMSSLNAGKCGNQTMEIRRRCSVRESERGGRVSVASGKAGGKGGRRQEARIRPLFPPLRLPWARPLCRSLNGYYVLCKRRTRPAPPCCN